MSQSDDPCSAMAADARYPAKSFSTVMGGCLHNTFKLQDQVGLRIDGKYVSFISIHCLSFGDFFRGACRGDWKGFRLLHYHMISFDAFLFLVNQLYQMGKQDARGEFLTCSSQNPAFNLQ